MRSVILFSGGLDSTIALYWALAQGDVLAAVSVDYSQRHKVELAQAVRIAKLAGVAHKIEHLGGNGAGVALTTSDVGISTAASAVVPCRNLALLTVAAGWLERLGGDTLVAGFSQADAADFPDCRPPFVRAAATAISLSLSRHVRIATPVISATKAVALRMAQGLGCWDAIGQTWTCYTPASVPGRHGYVRPCGACPSCVVRAKAFAAIGETDPASNIEVAS